MNPNLVSNMDSGYGENGSTALTCSSSSSAFSAPATTLTTSTTTTTSSTSKIPTSVSTSVSIPSIIVNSNSINPGYTSCNTRVQDGKSGSSCEDNLKEWTHTYHMRTLNLLNFPTNASSNRVSYRTVMNRARIGIVTGAAKSLNVLRQALQNSINSEIDTILQKYVERYFKPSMTNIKKNFGTNSVSEQHLQAACRQILEEAKKMYIGSSFNAATCSPLNGELIENGSDYENNVTAPVSKKRHHGDKRHPQVASLMDCESDSESNSQHLRPPPIKRKKLKGSPSTGRAKSSGFSNRLNFKSNAAYDIKREGPRWESNRLTTETRFVLGSKANKALGFGATRGRLYTKHADLFRYIGDHEDKQWLHEHGLMPPAGGKAYLIIKEDIEELLESDEYRNAPGVDGSSMGSGFTVPDAMLTKMKRTMESMRNETEMLRSLNDSNSKPNIPHIVLESEAINENCDVSSDIASNNSNPGLPDYEVENESREPSPTVDLDYLNSTVGEVASASGSPFSSLITTDLNPAPELLISQLPTDLSLT